MFSIQDKFPLVNQTIASVTNILSDLRGAHRDHFAENTGCMSECIFNEVSFSEYIGTIIQSEPTVQCHQSLIWVTRATQRWPFLVQGYIKAH